MKKVRVLLAALVVVATFTSCEDEDDNGNVMDGNNSAYDLTVSNANFSILRTALERTGLDTTLDAEGSFTYLLLPIRRLLIF
jgi:Fasciclin domain.